MKLILLGLSFFSFAALADQYVDPYTQSDGTFVQGHYKTDPNETRNDNYSTRGNVNPYTGQPGTQPRDEDFIQKEEEAPYNTNIYNSSPRMRGF
ncbi:hypothetical protein [Peredibacter starrii]|uniref:Uncharacterized protein n=1 Tax=Peredibacter starrii TaxID=28202 RepID=A0AAX4HUM3_9BACT|nr:hypothetical protein [Peredibacter starrii]WPU66660.1 hypothetical protein SOO65_07870 [Peredibacter starrii]